MDRIIIQPRKTIIFELSFGSYAVAIPTREQIARAFALDPEIIEEDPVAKCARLSAQLTILAEGSELPCETLDNHATNQILTLLVVAAFGGNPLAAAALQRLANVVSNAAESEGVAA